MDIKSKLSLAVKHISNGNFVGFTKMYESVLAEKARRIIVERNKRLGSRALVK